MTRMVWLASIALALVSALWASPSAEAAPCPLAQVGTVCAELDEPKGVLNLKDTVITIEKNGTALPSVTIPATSAAGGGTVSTSIPTAACEVATYKATAYAEYATSLGIIKSLSVSSTPGTGVLKDRSSEPACLKVPENFSLR